MKVGDQKAVQVAGSASWHPISLLIPDFGWVFGTDGENYPIRIEDNARPETGRMLILEVVATGTYMLKGDQPGPELWTIVKD